MKIGDLVRYKSWYKGPRKAGIIVDSSGTVSTWSLILWEDSQEWEGNDEIEVISA